MKKADWPAPVQGAIVLPPDMTPRPVGILERVKAGVRYAITGALPSSWFGPLQPLPPVAPPEVKGRAWDYPTGYNLQITPRAYEGTSFADLRGLADNYDLLRLVIETRKDQVSRMKWRFRVRESAATTDKKKAEAAKPRIDALTGRFMYPDNEHDWDEWLRMLLEDMFVIDAATIYPRKNLGGTAVYGYELIDGASIVPRINADGRIPEPPDVAYQQILKGVPAADFSRDELIYRPRNRRTNHIYGFSIVEQILMTVNIALRRQMYQLSFYTEGNVPEALASVPASWTPDQIREYQEWFDEVLTGNLAARRRIKFIPDGVAYHQTRPEGLKDEMDEWLARVVCYAFSVTPQQLIRQMNRATAQSSSEIAQKEGLEPIMNWLKRLIDFILVKYEGAPDIEFAWEEETAISPTEQAQIANMKVRNGEWTLDEARARDGLEPLEGGLGSRPLVYTGTGAQLLETVINPPEPEPTPEPPEGTPPAGTKGEVPPGEGSGKKEETASQKKEDQTAEKLEKAKKKVKPINRERKSIVRARKDLAALLMPLFRKAKKQAAQLDVSSVGKLAVAPEIEEKVVEVLKQLLFDGWTVITDDLEEILDAVTKDGVHQALLQIGMDVEPGGAVEKQAAELALEYAKERSAELVGRRWVDGELVDNPNAEWAITDSTREMLRSDVARAIEEGMSTREFADLIEENYAFSPERAEMIARTEIGNADVAGNMIAYRESGAVTGKYWILGSEHGGQDADECDENAEAGVIGMDELFPSGDDAPLAHPNCICDLGVVLEGEEEE